MRLVPWNKSKEETLGEINRKMQRALEESLMKNIHFQEVGGVGLRATDSCCSRCFSCPCISECGQLFARVAIGSLLSALVTSSLLVMCLCTEH